MSTQAPDHIGTDRQLFVDDYWVAESRGVERKLHSPVRREIAIAADNPWEERGVSYLVTFPDGEGYRGWYRCDTAVGESDNDSITGYAVSDDGIHWKKPEVGERDFHGSTRNNLVWTGPGINLAPFRDANPLASDAEKYKAIIREGKVLLALGSPDGIHWSKIREEPVLTDGPFDTLNLPFWDTWREEYVIYTRGVAGSGNFFGGVRWIRRATSNDFLNWSPLEDVDPGEAQYEHMYTNSCVQYQRAPGTYLMFPSRFVVDRTPDPDWAFGAGVNDIAFMSSRDGLNFDRSFIGAFLRPGLDQENWHERGIYMETGILQTSPEELSLFVSEHLRYPSARINRYTLRTDGFVSVNAGYGAGEFTTRPFVFSGSELELNYSTSAVGSVRVEVQDGEGRPLPGLSLADAPEKFGDEIDGVYNWLNDGSPVGLAGTTVHLRFVLKDADLYAFRFRDV